MRVTRVFRLNSPYCFILNVLFPCWGCCWKSLIDWLRPPKGCCKVSVVQHFFLRLPWGGSDQWSNAEAAYVSLYHHGGLLKQLLAPQVLGAVGHVSRIVHVFCGWVIFQNVLIGHPEVQNMAVNANWHFEPTEMHECWIENVSFQEQGTPSLWDVSEIIRMKRDMGATSSTPRPADTLATIAYYGYHLPPTLEGVFHVMWFLLWQA